MINITPIPAFNDNYIWLITHTDSSLAYVVDPGDGQVVHQALIKQQLQLAGVLITHRHNDHIGGISLLAEAYGSSSHPIPIYGPDSPAIPQITHKLYDQDTVTLFEEESCRVIATPGHTQEHISYFFAHKTTPALFAGDTLFAAGCGRLLGGTAEQLYHSLCILAELPEDTNIYCAHEYTLSNLKFAIAVEPQNGEIQARLIREQEKRQQGLPTIPSSIGLEKQTNPFLRIHESTVKQAILSYSHQLTSSNSDLFTHLRDWKDHF